MSRKADGWRPVALVTVAALTLTVAIVGRPKFRPDPARGEAGTHADSIADSLAASARGRARDERVFRSPSASWADFAVEIDGAIVLGARIRLERAGSGRWRAAQMPDLPRGRADEIAPPIAIAATAAADTSAGLRGPAFTTPAWFLFEGEWVRGAVMRLPLRAYTGEPLPWRGATPRAGSPADLELRYDSDGRLLEARDLLLRAGAGVVAGRASGARGRALVFDPNPVVAAGGERFHDGDDVDRYRIEVLLDGLDGSGRLHGESVRVDTNRLPSAREPLLAYFYSSVDPRFEEAMAYFHIHRARAWLDSLGFGGLFHGPELVTVHATALDESWYSPLTGRLEFGDGGVDDAEDADILLHEFGHAVHEAFVPGFGDGDTPAISEGFADYLAATLTGDPCIAEWDATSYSPDCLRRADLELIFPNDLSGDPHEDGRIWSGALWGIRRALGPGLADRIVLEGLLRQSPASPFADAARALVEAAAALGQDGEAETIRRILTARGLLERDAVSQTAEEPALVLLAHPAAAGTHRVRFDLPDRCVVWLSILDPAGRRVRDLLVGAEAGPGRDEVSWDGRDARGRSMPAGVYRIRFAACGRTSSIPLVRLSSAP